MFRKMGMNVVFLCCVVLLSACFSSPSIPLQRGTCICPPLAGAEGVDSYTKLMLHADGSDQGTSFTDSSSGAKTVANAESYDSFTKFGRVEAQDFFLFCNKYHRHLFEPLL